MPSATSHSSSGSAHSEDGSIHSQTSTLEYGHESFETFQAKVEALCQTIWGTSNTIFKIVRGPGGAYNRIIEISIHQLNSKAPKEVILRIPRFDGTRIDREIAAVRYVQQHSIPVAEVLAFDFTDNNALGRPYVIQNRIPGVNLHTVYPSLSYTQQKSIAEQIGHVLAKLLKITSSSAGVIEETTDLNEAPQTTPQTTPVVQKPQNKVVKQIRRLLVKTLKLASPTTGLTKKTPDPTPPRSFTVRPFDIKSPWEDEPRLEDENANTVPKPTLPDPLPKAKETTLGMLLSQFALWKAHVLKPDPDDYSMAEYYDRFATAAREMSQRNLLGSDNDLFTLCHMDFAPRNILVLIDDIDSSISITGILDWDTCIFAPSVTSCAPPSWLWAWIEDESEDEDAAGDEPAKEGAREVKEAFEGAVGREFLGFSYEKQWRLVRSLIRLAIYGMHSNEDLKAADELLEEWGKIRERVGAASA